MFRERRSIIDRLKEAISPTPFRERLVSALHQLTVQLRRIERTSAQLEARDKALYEKCIAAIKNNQTDMARIYTEECSMVRKMAKVALSSQFALERVVLRLDAVKTFGDLAVKVTPLRSVVGSVKSSLSNAMPEISSRLTEVDESLQEIVNDVGGVTEHSTQPGVLTGEAEAILQEASTLAEQQVKDKFPELPTLQSIESNIKPTSGPL